MTNKKLGRLKKIDDFRWALPRAYKQGMLVDGLVYADEGLVTQIEADQALEQVANVAFLPGIVGHSLAMPDIHWGYGFPVGGVAATRVEDGVISPGGIGFDINCGVRLLRSDLTEEEVRPRLGKLTEAIFNSVPSGLGQGGKVRATGKDMDAVLRQGARWAVEKGYGTQDDLEHTEERGSFPAADPSKVSERAKQRGAPQLGTLGSGNHFLEVQVVDEIYRPAVARAFGIDAVGQVLLLVHSGSRGLGHQVCDDYVRAMGQTVQRYGIVVPDRQLACAPFQSPEGQSYYAAMAGAANYAWANRQFIAHWVREAFAKVFGKEWHRLGLRQVYDVAHNIAKVESYTVEGKHLRVVVHRKGATRAFPAGHRDLPAAYRDVGQPVLVPGDMGRYSYVAVGGERALAESFGSTCHGAGRLQSRSAATKSLRGVDIAARLARQGITVRAAGAGTLAEEAPEAYKDVADVMRVVDGAGLALKVARMRPLGVVKG
ncbi:MAG: RtcB family protein [Chloroflexota bacterium]